MNEKGFTLVEVLVSLVAGGLLLGSLSWVISGLSDDLRQTELSRADIELSRTSTLLTDALTSARFMDSKALSLPRSPQKLSFKMHSPAALGSGYIDAQLSVAKSVTGQSLTLEWPNQDLPEVLLLSEMENIELQYVAEEDNRFLQSITIAWNTASNAQEITMHPKINAVGACIFDPISQRCRT